jgi:hypothetical protein
MAKPSKPRGRVKTQADRGRRKKTAPAVAGSRKPPGKTASAASPGGAQVRDLEAGDTESYLRLRQAFDSFQALILYYYATGENTQQRTERAEEVKNYLQSFTRKAPIIVDPDTECPPGMKPCAGGGCIPLSQSCFPVCEDP